MCRRNCSIDQYFINESDNGSISIDQWRLSIFRKHDRNFDTKTIANLNPGQSQNINQIKAFSMQLSRMKNSSKLLPSLILILIFSLMQYTLFYTRELLGGKETQLKN